MKKLTVNIYDDLSEKAIVAVLDALKLGYEIQCRLLKETADKQQNKQKSSLKVWFFIIKLEV